MKQTEEALQAELIKNYWELTPDNRFLSMFSGGKDSGLAFAIATSQAQPVALIHILENEKALYHGQSRSLVEAQASAMGVSVFYMPYKWWNNWETARHDLINLHNLKADSIVFGDIRLKYIFLGDIPLSQQTGYKPCLPLGGKRYDQLMDLIEEHRLISLITRINSPLIRPELLGLPFTREVFLEFSSLNIDPFGELDEFHTTLVDADCFSQPLRYRLVRRSDRFAEVFIEETP